MDTISVRISPAVKQEVYHFSREEKLELISEAARKLLLLGLDEWHKKRALELFLAGRVTLSKAASLAKINVWEFTDLVQQEKIPWIKEKRFIEQDLKASL